jgi:O-acetyl-ADP-ribose deacetylase (regulator of RNase III)
MRRIQLVHDDITKLEVEAIVNAANSSLSGGGGVDGAIHKAGGTEILEACALIRSANGGCPAGQAVITTAGRLKARFVIHTVGPVWKGGIHEEEKVLSDAYKNSLKLAADKKIRTIAFPNISTGVYAFPKIKAAKIAVRTVEEFLTTNVSIEEVIFCCFDQENFDIYSTLLKK